MNLTIALLIWLSFGVVAGVVAWAVTRRPHPFGAVTPVMLGVVGSVVGGMIGWVLPFGGPLHPASWVLSVAGAIAAVTLFMYADRKERESTKH